MKNDWDMFVKQIQEITFYAFIFLQVAITR